MPFPDNKKQAGYPHFVKQKIKNNFLARFFYNLFSPVITTC